MKRRGELAEAALLFDKVLEIDPHGDGVDAAAAWYQKGVILETTGRPLEDAAYAFAQACRLKPSDRIIRSRLQALEDKMHSKKKRMKKKKSKRERKIGKEPKPLAAQEEVASP